MHTFKKRALFIFRMTDALALPNVPTPGLQDYLDRALAVLKKFKIAPQAEENSLATLLEDLAPVDEARVMVIAKTVRHMSAFNQIVRDKVEGMHFGQRYQDITDLFDSVIEDARSLISHRADHTVSLVEGAQELWMRTVRGTPADRFEKIGKLYTAVGRDTREQLEREEEILNGYRDFRMSVQQARIVVDELFATQEKRFKDSQDALGKAANAVSAYAGTVEAEKRSLELAREESQRAFETEDSRYQLIKNVKEDLTVGYNVGETLMAKLLQTHGVKKQVYSRGVSFFGTNEIVYTTLAALFTQQGGLHEQTEAVEAMKAGADKALNAIRELGAQAEEAAIVTAFGKTYNTTTVQGLVDYVVDFQTKSREDINRLRKESAENAAEIERIVVDGKRRAADAILKYQTRLAA